MVREGSSVYRLGDEKQEPDEALVGECSRQRGEPSGKTPSLSELGRRAFWGSLST